MFYTFVPFLLKAAGQQTPSFRAPSLQAVGQQNSSFQTTRQTTPSFRATRQPSHSFQDQSTSSINDSQGNTKRLKLKTRDVLSLPQGQRIVVEFDLREPIGEADGLLAGFLGLLATDYSIFPMGFDSWPDMPISYFNDCFKNIIKPLFCFMTSEQWARRHVYHSIVKKWGASRQKLWQEFDDPLKTKEQTMANVPAGIARDQWASFVNYRLKDKTRRMSKINAENRKKQTNLHTNGSKSNARRRGEIVLGKEHPGKVRCLGVGATPTIAFKQSNVRVGGIRIPSNDAGCSSSGCEVKYNQLLNTLKAYMIMKEGSIPEQFAGIFDSRPRTPGDTASGTVSPRNARKSTSASNSSD